MNNYKRGDLKISGTGFLCVYDGKEWHVVTQISEENLRYIRLHSV